MPEIETTSLTIENVLKTYPNGIEAVRGISLEIEPGEVFGLVGPNGAGKTTLLKIASGLLYPESGSVKCGQADITSRPRDAARFVGLMPDPLGVYTDISAREYLEFFARVLEIPRNEIDSRISETVEMLGLAPWLSEEVETLSAGWQRRLALGRILLADLPVLLLDEPAAGLDITARTELLAIVRRLAGTRRSVIVSSHILPELEELADRFGIISKGAWVEIAPGQTFFTRSELMAGLGASVWRIRCNNNRKAASILLDLNFEGVETRQDILSFKGESDDDGAAALKAIVKENVDVFEFRREEMQLTNLVLDVLGRKEGAAE